MRTRERITTGATTRDLTRPELISHFFVAFMLSGFNKYNTDPHKGSTSSGALRILNVHVKHTHTHTPGARLCVVYVQNGTAQQTDLDSNLKWLLCL